VCGIAGILDRNSHPDIDKEVLVKMGEAINHRGPDAASVVVEGNLGLSFKRLSIIDLSQGMQPIYSENNKIVAICNGEIYNYKELRKELKAKGYKFKSSCDVEVIVPLYQEYGIDFVKKLNGQFAFSLYDRRNETLFLVRDHFGVCPLFFTEVEGQLIFGSEIKAILQHPLVKKEVNLTALDQMFTFPGIVSPTTFFKGISSLKPGHYLKVTAGQTSLHEYWDLEYPLEQEQEEEKPEAYYIEKLEELFSKSVKYRLNADVPVGFYLSGGLDSSLVGAMMHKHRPGHRFKSFSISYPKEEDKEHDESRFQRLVANQLNTNHHEINFDWERVAGNLRDAIYYSEGALKESYNTCSLALSQAVRDNNIKVILSGEGSDEFLGGYVGYRFDVQRRENQHEQKSIEDILDEQIREKLWGDSSFFYETNFHTLNETKEAIYSDLLNSKKNQFDCINNLEIDKTKLEGRHPFHKRSYLDLKLRLSDHLVSDHADRVNYANSVEGRYPFLDIELIEFIKTIPPSVKLKGLVEKYILKEMSKKYLPAEISRRQKFSWVAPSSIQLMKNNVEWVNDYLSEEKIRRQGYFNPATVERLKKMYTKDGFKLNIPFDQDLLMIILTFNIFLDVFEMPAVSNEVTYA
jgi:asparagine synthase (glutamine-hydrolysing)